MEITIYIALGVIAIIYALILNTKSGKTFALEYTWASVVIGNLLILAALWFLISRDAWTKVVVAFVVSGSPMIARSLINKMSKKSPPTNKGRFSQIDV